MLLEKVTSNDIGKHWCFSHDVCHIPRQKLSTTIGSACDSSFAPFFLRHCKIYTLGKDSDCMVLISGTPLGHQRGTIYFIQRDGLQQVPFTRLDPASASCKGYLQPDRPFYNFRAWRSWDQQTYWCFAVVPNSKVGWSASFEKRSTHSNYHVWIYNSCVSVQIDPNPCVCKRCRRFS